jgi:hypothetical protein
MAAVEVRKARQGAGTSGSSSARVDEGRRRGEGMRSSAPRGEADGAQLWGEAARVGVDEGGCLGGGGNDKEGTRARAGAVQRRREGHARSSRQRSMGAK